MVVVNRGHVLERRDRSSQFYTILSSQSPRVNTWKGGCEREISRKVCLLSLRSAKMRESILAGALVLLLPASALAAVMPDHHSGVPAAVSAIPTDAKANAATAPGAPVTSPRFRTGPDPDHMMAARIDPVKEPVKPPGRIRVNLGSPTQSARSRFLIQPAARWATTSQNQRHAYGVYSTRSHFLVLRRPVSDPCSLARMFKGRSPTPCLDTQDGDADENAGQLRYRTDVAQLRSNWSAIRQRQSPISSTRSELQPGPPIWRPRFPRRPEVAPGTGASWAVSQ